MVSSAPSRSDGALLAVFGIIGLGVLVLGAGLLSGFRLGLAEDPATLVLANGPRVLLGGAAGALLALAAARRLRAGREQPLRELRVLAWAAGAVAGGLAAVRVVEVAWVFVTAALLGGALFFAAVRWIDQPRRISNLGVGAALAVAATAFTLAGIDSLHLGDDFAGAVLRWLFGSLVGASGVGGAVVLAILMGFLVLAVRGAEAPGWLSPVAFGVAVGAVGPVPFVGALAARAVASLARRASPSAQLVVSSVAGGALVVALDAVPRLLMGGYALSLSLAATLFSVPVFLTWNRRRLRREVGGAGRIGEIVEVALIALATLAAAAYLAAITGIVRAAT